MLSRYLKAMIAVVTAFAAMPVAAQSTLCSEAIQIPSSAVKNVDDIVRIRAAHPGKRLNFNEVQLTGADFSGLDLSNLCFTESELIRSNWSGARGRDLQFKATNLSRSRWAKFRGERLVFHLARLDGAQLARSIMRETKFESTSMASVDASYADLSGGSFQGNWSASLNKARFDFANMTGFVFRCELTTEVNCGQYESNDVSLAGANLTGAAILVPPKHDWDMRNVVLDNTRLHLRQLVWLRESRINGSVIIEPTPWAPTNYDRNYDRHNNLTSVSLSPSELKSVWAARDRLNRPGFRCDKALSSAEKYICIARNEWSGIFDDGSLEFAVADRELNQAYILAWRKDRSVVSEQRQWLKKRDACMNLEEDYYGKSRNNCLETAYQERIDELWQLAGMETSVRKGQRRLFVDQFAGALLWEIQNEALRAKLVPAALGNSDAVVEIHKDRAGRLLADGAAVGRANNLGDLRSPEQGIVFDIASGFYGASEERASQRFFCPVVRFRGRHLDVAADNGSNEDTVRCPFNAYIMLGGGVSFGRLVEIPGEAD